MPACSWRLIYCFLFFISWPLFGGQLVLTTSTNAESNAAHSFIVVPPNILIPEGIYNTSTTGMLAIQMPFIVELQPAPDTNTQLQWKISIENNHYGDFDLVSTFEGSRSKKNNIVWQSSQLGHTVAERHRLIFRPTPPKHQPTVYKKGLGANGERRPYGGGTLTIDDEVYNPRLTYNVHLDIISHGGITESLDALIQMDKKDMIRQEYINHFGLKRYGLGNNGNLPVPYRHEITEIPPKPGNILGVPLSESAYGLMINDGILDLVKHVAEIYGAQLAMYRQTPLVDLNKKPLSVPDNQLWISGGWRNPERNEWFSNAMNGIHQRGGAADIIINEPPGHINTAISYWVLWNALQTQTHNLNAYWQLETNGRPMRTAEFKEDIEPVNGIPDAFDKADHLHINIHYNTAVDEQ